MARLIVGKGCEEYIEQLRKVELATRETIGEAIYEGAKIVTDQIDSSINSIPSYSREGKISKGVTDEQRKGLHDGLGIAKMQDDSGYLNVKVGMDGYNSNVTKTYPKGQPNVLIARIVESGSQYHRKTPFISKAVNSSKSDAEKAMADSFDKALQSIIK